jgi:hypothetical protein
MGNREVKSDIRRVARSLEGCGRLLALVITEHLIWQHRESACCDRSSHVFHQFLDKCYPLSPQRSSVFLGLHEALLDSERIMYEKSTGASQRLVNSFGC